MYIYSGHIIRFIAVSVMLFASFACTKVYDIKADSAKPLLVVEAEVNNFQPPYYVRLTQSVDWKVRTGDSNSSDNNDIAMSVTTARVIISDNISIVDTLEYIGYREDKNSYGWYVTNKIYGEEGVTYNLKIEYEGNEYTSTSTIPYSVQADSVGFITRKYGEEKIRVDIPRLYFKEPAYTKNYYLMYYTVNGHKGSANMLPYTIADDMYLNAYVNGIEIDNGQKYVNKENYMPIDEGAYVMVYLESINRETYIFYKGIIDQFNADGGGFSSIPATPPSNISNGALGLFKTPAISVITKKR